MWSGTEEPSALNCADLALIVVNSNIKNSSLIIKIISGVPVFPLALVLEDQIPLLYHSNTHHLLFFLLVAAPIIYKINIHNKLPKVFIIS